jgi:EamA domain-containing membrane protein RarD
MYILTQRIIWSMVFMAFYMTVTKKWHEIIAVQHGSYLGAAMTLKTICKEAI